jgi:hypothetical protein
MPELKMPKLAYGDTAVMFFFEGVIPAGLDFLEPELFDKAVALLVILQALEDAPFFLRMM